MMRTSIKSSFNDGSNSTEDIQMVDLALTAAANFFFGLASLIQMKFFGLASLLAANLAVLAGERQGWFRKSTP